MFELSSYHIVLTVIGGSILIAHWLPRWVSGREPAASALLIAAGYLSFAFVPGVPSEFDPVRTPNLWLLVSEMCLIIGLFGVGIRIDRLRVWKNWRPTTWLLAGAMPLTIAGVAFAGWLAGMSLAVALLLGAVLAPTDPVLASDVQVGPPLEGGEHPVRFTLTTEAGLNDGLAFPFLYLALMLGTASVWSAELIGEWLWRDIGYRLAVGLVCGVGLGWLVSRLLFVWPAKNALSKTESGLVALAGVLIVYGVTELLEGYGFIAVFVAGLTLRRSEATHDYHTKLHDFVESIERSITALLLFGLGAVSPSLLSALDWTGVAIGLSLIFIIRPLAALASLAWIPMAARQRAVISFYGIRGIGSIYYLAFAATHVDLPDQARLWAIVVFTIAVSTVVHGFTAGFAVERATGETTA